MKYKRSRYLLAVLVCALFGALPAAAQTGSITGQVTDAQTAAPISGARVEVLNIAGESLVGTLTDQQGRYRLANVGAGTYTVVAQMIGFEPQRIADVRVAAGEATNVSLQLVSRAIQLNPIQVTAGRRIERVLDAPARVEVVGAQAIEERPAVSPIDHMRAVPGVDIATQGVQSATVVTRGFNNIFSGALLMLTDHRIAGVPSLRVNLMHLIPSNNEDMERIEVVLGPGSALYGPNTANGVLHVFTWSPLTQQGTTVSVAGGEQNILQGSFRTSHLLNENLGVKVSGEYLRGNEWEFQDPVEQAERARVVAVDPNTRIGLRDFSVERWAAEARADWRVTPDLTAIVSAGQTTAAQGIELTGVGAAQVDNWTYNYVQLRTNWRRLFAQLYVNASNSGDTFTLRDGAPIIDRSRLLVGQLQHALALGERQSFTYGVDYLHTMPDTEGTIHGRYEDDDESRETGVFVQSETTLHPRFNLVLAGRVDTNNNLPDPVFSPRAALVYRAAENQTFRLTFNRAFSTPRSLDLFLDINAGPFPNPQLANLGYGLRAQGTGRTGFTFTNQDGSLTGMRSPFNPGGRDQLIPANVPTMWNIAVGILQAQGAFGPPTSAQAQGTAAYLRSLNPTDAQIGRMAWDVLSAPAPGVRLEQFTLPEIAPLRQSNTETIEVGYKGILANRLLIAADVWHSERNNFISALRPVVPLLLLNGQDIAAFLVSRGMNPQQAGSIAEGMAGIPLGVLSSENVSTAPGRSDFLVTYRNFGRITLWGSDISTTLLLTDEITLGANASFVNRDHFETEGEIIALNAPKTKFAATAGYRNRNLGFNGELRLRHNVSYPVLSAPFIATQCIGQTGPLVEPCVESTTLADLTLGYQVPGFEGATLQLLVQNLADTRFQSFPGVPAIGRMALLRLRYDF